MKPLRELLKGKAVNCQTEEEAEEFLSLLYKSDCKWLPISEESDDTYWDKYRNETGYCLDKYNIITFASVAWYRKHDYEVITYQKFKQLLNENNMKTKEVKIKVPEGYEIDKENSTFDCIKFKPIKKVLTYDDVAEELFKDKNAHYTDERGRVLHSKIIGKQFLDNNNCTSEKQVQKLLSINKLMNVAKYLRDKNKGDNNYFMYIDENGHIDVSWENKCVERMVYFDCRSSVVEAIEILGEETIKLALSTDW